MSDVCMLVHRHNFVNSSCGGELDVIRDVKADLDRVKQAMLHNVGGAIEMKLHQI